VETAWIEKEKYLWKYFCKVTETLDETALKERK